VHQSTHLPQNATFGGEREQVRCADVGVVETHVVVSLVVTDKHHNVRWCWRDGSHRHCREHAADHHDVDSPSAHALTAYHSVCT
jgi:hypothetical protein